MPSNEPPRPTLRQRITGLTVVLLIVVLWAALVMALAVTMILRGVPDQNELPDYYYDPGV